MNIRLVNYILVNFLLVNIGEWVKVGYLLHLELNGGLEVKDLGVEVIRVRHQGGELSCLHQV